MTYEYFDEEYLMYLIMSKDLLSKPNYKIAFRTVLRIVGQEKAMAYIKEIDRRENLLLTGCDNIINLDDYRKRKA